TMKVVLALVALLAVGTQAFVVPHNEAVVLSSNLITKLLTKAFEYARTILTENDPIDIPDLPAMTITDDDVDMTVQLSDVKLGNASDFEVTTLEASLSAMNATFEIFLPSLYLEGNHYVNGTAWDAEVYGDGTFTVTVTNFTQAGQVQLYVVD
ncbi:JHBP domain-containing protein, partial [Neisseria meningitidis]|uniref:JHBP domain-containing protein n=1 Tax=Neisseria meningitidis TaxID=487 RepID=UPI001C560237